jgi:outer membrane protein OmpA-like peptidoglycan-associated protein
MPKHFILLFVMTGLWLVPLLLEADMWTPRRDAASVVLGDSAEDCDCPVDETPVAVTCADFEAVGAGCVWEDPQTLLVSLGNEVTHFDTAKDTLKPAGIQRLRELSKVLKAFPENNIYIDGHTDNRGSVKMNKALSFRRANRVRNALASFGLVKEFFKSVEGWAFEKPVGDNNTKVGRARNRRTEIRLRFTLHRWNESAGRLEKIDTPQVEETPIIPDRLDTEDIDDGK